MRKQFYKSNLKKESYNTDTLSEDKSARIDFVDLNNRMVSPEDLEDRLVHNKIKRDIKCPVCRSKNVGMTVRPVNYRCRDCNFRFVVKMVED